MNISSHFLFRNCKFNTLLRMSNYIFSIRYTIKLITEYNTYRSHLAYGILRVWAFLQSVIIRY